MVAGVEGVAVGEHGARLCHGAPRRGCAYRKSAEPAGNAALPA
jgi:hypothetical protein